MIKTPATGYSVTQDMIDDAAAGFAEMGQRNRNIATLLAFGYCPEEIGKEIGLKTGSVYNAIKEIKVFLQVSNMIEIPLYVLMAIGQIKPFSI